MKDIKKEKEELNEEIEEEIEHPFLKKLIISTIIIIVLSLLYINLIGTKLIEVKEYKISSMSLPQSFNGLKIVHFSDIHYGTTINDIELNKMVNKINELKPDIILFTGDLIDKNINIDDKTKQEVIDILNKLEVKQYKYAIYGDEDNNESFKEIMESTNFILLDNSSTLLYYKDSNPILITGYNTIESSPNYSLINDPVNEIDTNMFYKIVLVHEPDSFDYISSYNPNLVLAGHTLGNTINIPGIKNLFIQKNAKKYSNDYYNINNIDFYISNGLGTSNFKSRINNRPSINFYRLYTE